MDNLPVAIAMQQAVTQQKAIMGMLKANQKVEQALVNMVAEQSASISASGRGQRVNLSV